MKTLRIIALVFGVLLLLAVILITAVFWIPGLPTMVANRVVNGQDGIEGTVGKVDLDWNGMVLHNVELVQDGGAHLQLRAADVRVEFLPLARGEVKIHRLHASGIVADLRRMPVAKPDDEPVEPFEFDGILRPIRESGLQLWIDDVRVEGRFLLPEERRGTFLLTGGGIAPGAAGELHSEAVLTMASDDASGLDEVREETVITLTQDALGPTAVALTSETRARGSQLATEGRILKVAELRQTDSGEAYMAAVRTPDGADVLSFEGAFAYGQDVLSFSYEADLDEATIAAWGLAELAPSFTLHGNGEGSFDLKALAGDVQGDLTGSLTPPQPEAQAALPAMEFTFTFAADSDGELATLERFEFHVDARGEPDGRALLQGAFGGNVRLDSGNETPFTEADVNGDVSIDLDQLWTVLLPPESDAGNQGVAEIRLRASMAALGGPAEAELSVRLTGVAAPDDAGQIEEVTIEGTAGWSEDGTLTIHSPIRIDGPSGLTALEAAASVSPAEAEDDPLRFNATLTSEVIHGDDLQLLADAYLPPAADEEGDAPDDDAPAPPVSDEPDTAPAWAGMEGEARAEIGRITLRENAITDLLAVFHVDERAIALQEFSAAFAGEPMSAAFELAFTPDSERPYTLESAFQIDNFDLSSLDQELRGEDQPALLKGIFNVAGRVHGTGPNLETLPQWLQAEVDVNATEATYYPLGNFAFGDTASGLLGQLGGIAAGVLRGRDEGDYASAVQEVVSLLQGVETNELALETTLREGLDFSIDRFELLAPQLSFVGRGRLPFEPGKPFSAQTLTLNLEIGARGNAARAFNKLRLLEDSQNAFGYYVGPAFQNAGPIGNPTSTLTEVLKASATAYFTGERVSLPDDEEAEAASEPGEPNNGEPEESENEAPSDIDEALNSLDALRKLLEGS